MKCIYKYIRKNQNVFCLCYYYARMHFLERNVIPDARISGSCMQILLYLITENYVVLDVGYFC